ncbi:cDENN domain [Trypanosoma melophagium]|uniref:cDENN domain n=1 Tax=Trypanosoma melophagium TaxID=715481 RepID=UPI00351A93B6|nr:cDENN domain [Trypanosoma melophagium]
MQSSSLAHTVSLHRVRLQSPGDCGGNSGEVLCPRACLEPIVVFSEKNKSSRSKDCDGAEEGSIIDQYTPLSSLVECFCARLLMRQLDTLGRQSASRKMEEHLGGVTSLVAEEGLYIQLPSCGFTSECVRSARNGTSMDVVIYNSLQNRWWKGTGATDGNGQGDNSVIAGDEGYIYGFVQFIGLCDEGEGLLLAAFSTFPLFNMLRTVVLETLPQVVRVARDVGSDCQGIKDVGTRKVSAVYANALSPLRGLVDTQSAVNKTSGNRQFYLRLLGNDVSITRPDDLRCPFVDVPLSILLLSFSYDALRVIYSILLQEKKVVFIGATPQHASACVVSVQAMLLPFVWSLPIVPYLPPEACDVLESLGDSGFILGSTPDVVPSLMLRSSISGCQRRGTATAAGQAGEEKPGEDEQCRIWFADGRTGVVGVSPLDTDHVSFTALDLVPPSEKVKDAMKRVVSKEQRQMFHGSLGSAVAQTLGAFSPCSTASIPFPPVAILEEVHGAFLEYNVHRLVGNYRKGLFAQGGSSGVNNNSVSGTTSASRMQGGAAFGIDYTRFLPGNLDNNIRLARCIVGTRMYRHWESAVLSLETLGLLQSLLGEFVRGRLQSLERGTAASSLAGKETLATHYYLSIPRMAGMLCLFYIRSVRRFPELYNDLEGNDVLRLSEGVGVVGPGSGGSTVTIATATGNSRGNIGSSSNTSTNKGLMRALFSRATKAVKNSLVTHHHRIPIQTFVQAYGSFVNKTSYEKDPSKPAMLSKEFKNRTAIAATFAPNQQQDQGTLPISSNVSASYASDVEDVLYGTSMACAGDVDGTDVPSLVMGGIDESRSSVVCRRLPLDIIHQFGRYHVLLDPTKDTVYTTGACSGTMQVLSRVQLERYVELGMLFVVDSSILPSIESKRQLMLCMPQPQYQPLPQPQRQKQEPVLSPCPPWESGGGGSVSDVLFEAQPLPFSMDVVTRAPELPPRPGEFLPPQRSFQNRLVVSSPFSKSSGSKDYQSSAVSCSGESPPGGGNVMDDLFAFALPKPSAPPGGGSDCSQLEDFFK